MSNVLHYYIGSKVTSDQFPGVATVIDWHITDQGLLLDVRLENGCQFQVKCVECFVYHDPVAEKAHQ